LFGATAIVLLEKRPTSIEQELKKLLDRGLKYVMRTQGKGEIYEIEPTRLRYIDIHEWNNINVKMTADQKKLVGISEELFQKLS
jgi:DNA-binding transcriptional ArsR family regulator